MHTFQSVYDFFLIREGTEKGGGKIHTGDGRTSSEKKKHSSSWKYVIERGRTVGLRMKSDEV